MKDYKRDFPRSVLLVIKDPKLFQNKLDEQVSQMKLSLFNTVGGTNTQKMILIVYESVLNDNDNNLKALQNNHSRIELIVVCGNERSIEYLLNNEIFKKVIINTFV